MGASLTPLLHCAATLIICERSKYRFMESSFTEQRQRLKRKLPDISSSLECVRMLQGKKVGRWGIRYIVVSFGCVRAAGVFLLRIIRLCCGTDFRRGSSCCACMQLLFVLQVCFLRAHVRTGTVL